MTAPSDPSAKLFFLDVLLAPDAGQFRNLIVRRALDLRSQASRDLRRACDDCVRRVRIPGFRDASQAPIPTVLPAILRRCDRIPEYRELFVDVWLSAQHAIAERMRAFLLTQSMQRPPRSGDLTAEDQQELQERCRAAFSMYAATSLPEHDTDRLEQQALFAAVFAELLVERRASEELVSSLWRQAIATLRSLPDDALEWAELPLFVDRAKEILGERRLRLHQWQRLQQRLRTIHATHATVLAFLEWTGCAEWTFPGQEGSDPAIVSAQVDDFEAALARYGPLLDASRRVRTKREMEQTAASLQSVAAELEGLYGQLAAVFADRSPVAPEARILDTGQPTVADDPSRLQETPTVEQGGQAQEVPAIEEVVGSSATDAPATLAAGRPGHSDLQEAGDHSIDVESPDAPALVDARTIGVGAAGADDTVAVPAASDNASVSGDGSAQGADSTATSPDGGDGAGDAGRAGAVEPVATEPADDEAEDGGTQRKQPLEEPPGPVQKEEAPPEPQGQPTLVPATMVWHCIQQDDLAGAYWLAGSLEASGIEPPVPAWLLEAVQGARWVTDSTSPLLGDLATLSLQHVSPLAEPARLLAASAALCPIVLSPATGLEAWLDGLDGRLVGLRPLADTLRSFAHSGIAFRKTDLSAVIGQDQLQAERAKIIRQFSQWRDDARRLGTHFHRGSEVLRVLLGGSGRLQPLMEIVLGDRLAERTVCRGLIEEWSRRETLDDAIEELDGIRPGRPRAIAGNALNRIRDQVASGVRLAEQWLALAEQTELRSDRGSDWVTTQIRQLSEGVSQALPATRETLETLQRHELAIAAAACCAARSVSQLCELLDRATPTTVSRLPVVALPPKDGGIRAALAQRLFWLPELDLEDNGEPSPTGLPAVAPALVAALGEGRTAAMAIERWIAPDRQDYRFVDFLLPFAAEERRGELSERRDEHLSGSIVALREHKKKTIVGIERALLDGIIDDTERAEYLADVENVPPEDTVLRFQPFHVELDKIQVKLLRAREARLAQQQVDWLELRKQLLVATDDQDAHRRWSNLFEDLLRNGDTRVIDECLSQLRNQLTTGPVEQPPTEAPRQWRDILQEFVDNLPHMEQVFAAPGANLMTLAVELDGAPVPGWVRSPLREEYALAMPIRQQASAAFRAWSRLKAAPGGVAGRVDAVRAVLELLGYSASALPGSSPVPQRKSEREGWAQLVAAVGSARRGAPVPQFGTWSHGHLDLVCLWERPGFDPVASRLRDLDLRERNVVVLYFGRLSRPQRIELLNTCRRENLGVVVVDEILLAFLASELQDRLSAFLHCALPFARVNPFTPFVSGNVPPEMFRGREDLQAALLRPEDSCIVFGGRQLGKSALLRQVAVDFHDPSRDRYAVIEDIKLVGDPAAGIRPDDLWRRLRDRLAEVGLFSRRVSDKSTDLLRQIEGAVLDSEKRRVLVLLDEADNFLQADARQDFPIVASLKNLMERTGRRFKVVLAGLHNVQRFRHIPNQPLAHLGRPILVGPLEPVAARELVEQPLQALGFRFRDQSLSLRILSYTNYHPGLIQLFCRDLVNALTGRRVNTLPPFDVTKEDIEGAYTIEVRKEIKERFEWTIRLDLRYQAIILAMIMDQIGERDGYSRTYTAGQIEQQAASWWRRGFEQVDNAGFRGLLDELCGLGVLVQDVSGRYRLRGPNLVRLVGSDEELERELMELESKPVPTTAELDHHHPLLGHPSKEYSPFTYEQERRLNPERSGVSLVFASRALGLDRIDRAIHRFVPPELWSAEEAFFQEVPAGSGDADTLNRFLEDLLQVQRGKQRCLVLVRALGIAETMAQQVEVAVRFCMQRRQMERPRLRVFVVFQPDATWSWLGLPAERRQLLEDQRVDTRVWPGRWTAVGVQQLLEHADLVGLEERVQAVLQATGGWPLLLRRLLDSVRGLTDPRPAAYRLTQELLDPALTPPWDVLRDFGLSEGAVAARAFRQLAELSIGREVRVIEFPDVVEMAAGLALKPAADAVREYLLRLGLVDLREGKLVPEPLAAHLIRLT